MKGLKVKGEDGPVLAMKAYNGSRDVKLRKVKLRTGHEGPEGK
jgi:hypothetical protein